MRRTNNYSCNKRKGAFTHRPSTFFKGRRRPLKKVDGLWKRRGKPYSKYTFRHFGRFYAYPRAYLWYQLACSRWKATHSVAFHPDLAKRNVGPVSSEFFGNSLSCAPFSYFGSRFPLFYFIEEPDSFRSKRIARFVKLRNTEPLKVSLQSRLGLVLGRLRISKDSRQLAHLKSVLRPLNMFKGVSLRAFCVYSRLVRTQVFRYFVNKFALEIPRWRYKKLVYHFKGIFSLPFSINFFKFLRTPLVQRVFLARRRSYLILRFLRRYKKASLIHLDCFKHAVLVIRPFLNNLFVCVYNPLSGRLLFSLSSGAALSDKRDNRTNRVAESNLLDVALANLRRLFITDITLKVVCSRRHKILKYYKNFFESGNLRILRFYYSPSVAHNGLRGRKARRK